jgi:hypothetical protein
MSWLKAPNRTRGAAAFAMVVLNTSSFASTDLFAVPGDNPKLMTTFDKSSPQNASHPAERVNLITKISQRRHASNRD